MKADGYLCDVCGQFGYPDEVVGVIPTEDMFDKLSSYPTSFKPEKTSFHYCISCYKKNVLRPAERTTDRRKDEDGYKMKIRELSFSLRQTVILRSIFAKKRKK